MIEEVTLVERMLKRRETNKPLAREKSKQVIKRGFDLATEMYIYRQAALDYNLPIQEETIREKLSGSDYPNHWISFQFEPDEENLTLGFFTISVATEESRYNIRIISQSEDELAAAILDQPEINKFTSTIEGTLLKIADGYKGGINKRLVDLEKDAQDRFPAMVRTHSQIVILSREKAEAQKKVNSLTKEKLELQEKLSEARRENSERREKIRLIARRLEKGKGLLGPRGVRRLIEELRSTTT